MIKRQCVRRYNPCARMYNFHVTVTSPLVDKIDSAQYSMYYMQAVAQLVKAQRYKSKGRGLGSRLT